jgi:hypothetical protein
MLSNQDISKKHILFNQMLGGHAGFGLNERERQLRWLIEFEHEFSVLHHDRAILESLGPPLLCNLVHEETVVDHILKLLLLRPILFL